MAGDSILTPGYQDQIPNTPETPSEVQQYLLKNNYLGEFSSEDEKTYARQNIAAASTEELDTLDNKVQEELISLRETIEEANSSTINNFTNIVDTKLTNTISKEGDIPFTTNPRVTNPDSSDDLKQLSTKGYIIDKVNGFKKSLSELDKSIKNQFTNYYTKEETYSKDAAKEQISNQINEATKNFITPDTNVHFKKIPSTSITPQTDSQLTNKKYVDKKIKDHIQELDPHGLKSLISAKLTNYALKEDVFPKEQTYSRNQLDSILYKEIKEKVKELFGYKLEQIDEKFNTIDNSEFVKSDGTIPFKATQKGVDAVEAQDLVTLHQLEEKLSNEIKNIAPVWITTGKVESTVGHVDDNSEVPERMTFQEIMDAIFYGKGVAITVPPSVSIGEKANVTICIHGSTSLVEYAELFQEGIEDPIFTFSKEDFEDGCVTVEVGPINEDTKVTIKVHYTNDTVIEDSKVIKCSLPVFVGSIEEWKQANTITMDYLKILHEKDINKTENQFLSEISLPIIFNYNFEDANKRRLCLIVPKDFPDLESMSTTSQNFGIEAFDIVTLPLRILEEPILYRAYVYKQALVTINQKVTFNFKTK